MSRTSTAVRIIPTEHPALAPRKLSVLIPAYNEQATIEELVRRVLATPTERAGFIREVIVVDDASRDDTAAIVARIARSQPAVRLLRHERNRGKSAAIRTALAAATGDTCIIQDADLEYDPADYLPLLFAVRDGAQVVFGSRFLARSRPAEMALPNWIANRMLTGLANLLFQIRITDEATCLKMFPTELLRGMALRREGFDFCPEVTAKVARRGIPIHEVPIRYRARSVEEGKKIRWTDAVRAVRVMVAEAIA